MESNFEDYNLKLQTSILNPTKHAFALPTDIQFHKSIDHDFAEEIEACSTKVLSITNKLLTLATSSTTTTGGKGKTRLFVDQNDVVDDFDSVVVDIMDQLLERVVSETLCPWLRFLSSNMVSGQLSGHYSRARQGSRNLNQPKHS